MDLHGITIAFDFDGTITTRNHYPEIKEIRPNIDKCINNLYLQGANIVIWTCRNNSTPNQFIAYNLMIETLNKHNIHYHSINKNLLQDFVSYKIYADLYVDDNSLDWNPDIDGLELYEKILNFIKNK